MNAPMFGTWLVEVKEVHPFAIHGDQYFELVVVKSGDSESSLVSLKVPLHAVKGVVPMAGEKRMLSFLAGQVTSAKLVT